MVAVILGTVVVVIIGVVVWWVWASGRFSGGDNVG